MTVIFHLLFAAIRRSALRICFFLVCALSLVVGRAQTHVEHVLDMGRVALSYSDYITAISLFKRYIEARTYTAESFYILAAAKT